MGFLRLASNDFRLSGSRQKPLPEICFQKELQCRRMLCAGEFCVRPNVRSTGFGVPRNYAESAGKKQNQNQVDICWLVNWRNLPIVG